MTATTPLNDYDARGEVAPNEANVTRWQLTDNLGIAHAGALVWFARDITCCPTQDRWHASMVPTVWDQTGAGDITVASYVQCGGCGSLISPVSDLLEGDPTSEEIAEAAAAVTSETARQLAADAADLRARLLGALEIALDEGDDLDRSQYPDLDGMAEPGVGNDNGELVAWDYDPRDLSRASLLQVSETELDRT